MAELSPSAFGFPQSAGPQELDPSAFGFDAPAKPTGGLSAAAKQAIGSTIKGVGQAATDFLPGVTAANPVSAYGQSVIDANPTATNSLGDIVESPWTATKEAVGNAAGSMGSMLGARALGMGITAAAPFTGPAAPVVAGAGQLIANVGPFVAAALPSYGGIRESQIQADPANEADGKSKAIALLGAGTVGAIEGAFGPQAWALAAMKKGGIESIAKRFADAKSLPGAIGKGILKGGAIEGSEEIPQNVIEQVAGYRDPTTRQAIGETLLGGAMGAIGGGVLSGGMAGMAYRPKGPIEQAADTGEITGANEQKRQEQAIAAAAAPTTGTTNASNVNAGNDAAASAQVAQDAGQNASTAQAAAHAPLAVADAPTTGETNEEAQAGTAGAEGASVAPASAAGIGGAGSPTGIAGVSTGAASGTAANLPGHVALPESEQSGNVTGFTGTTVTLPIEQQQAIATPQITPPAPAFPVTPAAPIANDQQAESAGYPTSSTTFNTWKGSSYVFHDDGTTTRNKAPRPEHPGESGVQPRSAKTFFVTEADRSKLDLLQASWPKTGLVVNDGNGTIGVRYLEGPHSGKIAGNTIVPFQTAPAVGLHPIESWGDGYTVHFGNAITSVNSQPGQQNGNKAEVAKPAAPGRAAQPDASAGQGVAPVDLPDVSNRTDLQLTYLSTNGQPWWRDAAIAEIARRSGGKMAEIEELGGKVAEKWRKSGGKVAEAPTLQYHQQPTPGGAPIEQQSAPMPVGEYGKAKAPTVTSQSPANTDVFLSSRTDDEIGDMSNHTNPKIRELGDAETARRSAMLPKSVSGTSANNGSATYKESLTVRATQVVAPETASDAPQTQADQRKADLEKRKAELLAKRKQSDTPPNMRRDDLVGAILRVTGGDGIHSSMALDTTGDTANRQPKLRGLFTNKGTADLGDVATLLRNEEGYDVRDGKHLAELIRQQAAGDRVTSMESSVAEADSTKEEQYRDSIRKQAKELGLKTAFVKFSDLENRVNEVIEKRRKKLESEMDQRSQDIFDSEMEKLRGVDPDDVDAMLLDLHQNGYSGREFQDEAVKRIRAMSEDVAYTEEANRKLQEAADAERDSEEPQIGQHDEGTDQESGSRPDSGRSTEAQPGEGFALSGQSNSEAAKDEADRVATEKDRASADAKAKAEDKAAADRKAIKQASEKAADTFVLGGNALDNLTGQTSIFDGPAAPPKVETNPDDTPAWHTILPDEGLEITDDQRKPMGYERVGHAIAADAYAAITRDQLLAGGAMSAYYRPAADGRNGIVRLLPDDQTPGKPWALLNSEAIRVGMASEEQVIAKLKNWLRSAPVVGDISAPKVAEKMPDKEAPSADDDRLAGIRYRAMEYWKEKLKPAMVAYLNAYNAFGVGRMERNKIKPEGMSSLEWLHSVRSQQPTWDKGRKIGYTGIQMLEIKDLWPTDDGSGRALQRAMLAAIRAYNGAPMVTGEWEEEVFGNPEEKPSSPTGKPSTGRYVAPNQNPANTEDAGAELTYNRRNRLDRGLKWEDIANKDEALRVKEATKAKVYPKPDYKAMIGEGMAPQLAHIVKQVYDSLASSPRTRRSTAPSDEDIKNYIAGVNRVMDAVIEWANDSDLGGKWLAATVTNSLGRYASALDMMANAVNGEDSKSLLSKAFPDGYEPVKNELVAIGGNKVYGALQPGSQELNDSVKAIKDGWPESQESWQRQGITVINGNDVKAETSGADYGGEKKEVVVRFTIPNGTLSRTLKRVTVDGTRDPDSPEVRKVIDDGLAEFSGRFVLLNKSKTVVSTHATEYEAKAAARALVSREGRKSTVSDKGISVTAAERIGEAKRLPGEDISSDKLREAFKFKGVNFGNWMKGDANEKERQLHLNHAYDSFMDLADVLGVPPEAMSLNGMLGVAIGAQGSGGFAAAHFVPGVNEINLTRESGAGSLAHEWGHALDHYFARQAGLTRAPSPFLTSVLKTAEGSEIRQEVLDKFKAIVQAMHKRPITQEEVESQRQEKIASAMRNLDGWMKSIVRGDLMDDAEVAKAIERIKSGDLGDGFVAAGRSSAVKPAIAEFGKIIKEKTGRVLQRTDLSAINSWATNLQYLQSQNDGDAAHVPQQMVETDYSKSAASLDKEKGGKPYWSTTLEMFARAFDAFVSDTLEAKAAKNTYLSHAGRDGKTVPTGVERTAINAAIKGLVDTVETKSGEDGNVVLYNVATDTLATPADKAIYGMVAEGKSAREILDFISKGSRRPFNRYLANALKNLGVLPTIKLDSMSGWNINDRKMAAKYAAAYNPKTDTIALFTAREAERHALHELTHAATLKAIAAGGPASVQMRGLFLYLKRNGSLDGQYGMSNLDEFVAEAFSNPKFQAALKAIPAPKGSTLKNAWEWFVRAVRTALGMKSAAMETALDRAMTVGAQLMQENVRLNEAAQGDSRYALAWHGTPHVWAPEPGFPHGRPRLDKMGTGEGAQAYGWGWYSAESNNVAADYKERLSSHNLRYHFNGHPLQIGTDEYAAARIANSLDLYSEDIKATGGERKFINRELSYAYTNDRLATQKLIKKYRGKVELKEDNGTIYRLDIPDDVIPKLLDWDRPLSEQTAKVQDVIEEAGLWDGDTATTGQTLYEQLRLSKKSPKAASEHLATLGIVGTRYLDGQSRSNGSGTYNYVIWDQPTLDKVALLERNGEKLDAMREADAVRYSRATIPDTITINGVDRPTTNSNGKPIAQDEDGVRRFWEWFGSSAVVDEQGRPRVVYHGTAADFSVFKQSDVGIHFGNLEQAQSRISRNGDGSNIMPTYLSIQNPLLLKDATSWADPVHALESGIGHYLSPGLVKEIDGLTAKYRAIPNLRTKGGQDAAKQLAGSITVKMRAELKAKGYDGIIYANTHDGETISERMRAEDSWIAFDPEQAKSATGNIGEFSPTNQDIRYNVATDWYDGPGGAPVRNAWQAAKAKAAAILAPKTLDKIIYELQDKFIDLKNLREHIRKIGGTITDMNDAYLGEELYHKRLAYRTERFQKDELLPLLEEAKAKGISKDALESFLHARHAPEANAAMAKRNPNQAEIDAGMMRSGAVVKALETQLQRSTARNSATAAISKALNAARGELAGWKSAQAFRGAEEERTSLSGMSDADAAALMGGLAPDRRAALDSLAYRIDEINQGTINLLESYGLMSKESLAEWRKAYKHYVPLHRDEAHPDSFSHPIGQGFSTKGDAAKRRTGSNQKVTNILGHIAMQREAALTRGEKNLVMRKLYLMARQNPLPDVWKIGPVPMIDTIDKGTGFVMAIPDPLHKTRPNVLVLRIAGKDVSITFNEHNPEALRMAHALKNLDVDDLHYMIPVVGKMTRWFASINTQYNPIFGVVNLLRDTQEAAINLSSTELAGKQGEILKDQMSILKAVLKNKGRMPTTGPWAALFDEFNAIGGSTGFRDLFLDAEARSKALQDTINSLDQGNVGKAWDAVAGWLSDYNEAMENSTRLAAYKAGIDSGMSKERAASLAKNLTVNFNRKGRQTRELGALYAFFNAAVQGTARMAQTLTGPSGRKIMAGGVMLGAMNAMIAIAAMGGGNGDDDEWEKIPEFVKENSFIIPIGKSDYISIPMPIGFKLFPNIGRLAAEMAWYKDKTAGKQLASLFTVLADALNPLGGSSPPMQIIAPTVLDPFVALAQNRDWTGKPIYIENRNSLDPSPGMIRSKESATPWAKWFAGVVNGATGGTEYTPGGWSPTPDQIDFVIGQLTGGVGREAGKIASTVAAPLTGEELPPHKIPLLGRFYGSTEGQAGQSEKFYENITLANEAENEIKGRAKAGLSAVEYIKEHPGANVLAARGNVAERQVAALRKMRRAVVARDLPGSTEKVLALNERIALVMTRFNREAERLSQ